MEPLPPLPPCDGPKLAPFAQNFEDLTFEPELVLKDPDYYVHSVVIKAKLNGETYGIKFVSGPPPTTLAAETWLTVARLVHLQGPRFL